MRKKQVSVLTASVKLLEVSVCFVFPLIFSQLFKCVKRKILKNVPLTLSFSSENLTYSHNGPILIDFRSLK